MTQQLQALKVGDDGGRFPLSFLARGRGMATFGVLQTEMSRCVLWDLSPETSVARRGTCTVPGVGLVDGRGQKAGNSAWRLSGERGSPDNESRQVVVTCLCRVEYT